jgi:hypothetical protein
MLGWRGMPLNSGIIGVNQFCRSKLKHCHHYQRLANTLLQIQLWIFRSLFLLCPRYRVRSDFQKFAPQGRRGESKTCFLHSSRYLKGKYRYLYSSSFKTQQTSQISKNQFQEFSTFVLDVL